MSRLKILVVLNDAHEHALRTLAYTFELTGKREALIVVGYIPTKNDNGHLKNRLELNAQLQSRYGQATNIKLLFRKASGFTTSEVMRESKFADIVVMSESSVKQFRSASDFQMINNSFSSLGVPLLIIPENAEKPDEILITYNGLPQGIGAIKQFCQLMGDLCSRVQVTLLEMNHQCNQYQREDERLFVEYLKQHCTNLGIYKMSNESLEKVLQMINSSGNAIIVAGAFADKNRECAPGIDTKELYSATEKLPGFFGAV